MGRGSRSKLRKKIYNNIAAAMQQIAVNVQTLANLESDDEDAPISASILKKNFGKESASWDVGDLASFEEGLRKHGPDAKKIHEELPNKTVKEIDAKLAVYIKAGRVPENQLQAMTGKRKVQQVMMPPGVVTSPNMSGVAGIMQNMGNAMNPMQQMHGHPGVTLQQMHGHPGVMHSVGVSGVPMQMQGMPPNKKQRKSKDVDAEDSEEESGFAQ